MGWTVNTYAGTRATGQPSNYRLCMYELIRGIRERYTALGWVETFTPLWYIGDRTAKANPTLDDLAMLHSTGRTTGSITGADYNYAYENMKRITDKIKVLINTGRFMTTSGGTTPWTVASVEAEIGASLDYPTKVNEARWWQACQDALDLLINAYSLMTPKFDGGAGYFGVDRSLFPEPTPQSVWDLRADNTMTTTSYVRLGNNVRWGVAYEQPAPPPDGYRSLIQYEVNGHFLVNGFVSNSDVIHGTLVDANYIYTAGANNDDYIGGSVYADMNGNSIDIAATATNAKIAATPTLGAQITYSIEITTTEPSSVPFDTDVINSYIGIAAPSLEVWHDLTTYLTDQA